MPQLVPANRIESFDVVVPAGTAKLTPLETDTSWAPGNLIRVEVDVPDGHAGYTGFYLAVAHGRAIPLTDQAWIVANDHSFGWDMTGQLDSGAWSLFGYNTGLFSHTFHVRYFVLDQYLVGDTAPTPSPLTPVLV